MARLAAISVAVAIGFACTAPPPTLADRVKRIESQVWSPYCPGRLLSECSTAQAQELREEIAARLRSGSTPDEILEWFAQNYGAERVARPPSGTSGLAVWLVPAGVAIAGLVLLLGVLRRWTRPAPPQAPPPVRPSDDAIKRLRDEVQRDL